MVNGKIYIGITSKTVEDRFLGHTRSGHALHNSIKKYGKNKFTIQILKSKLNKNQANKWEIYYISKYKSLYPSGYNLTKGGEGQNSCDLVKRKIRNKAKLRFESEENRNKQREIAKNQWKDPEFRKKMEAGLKRRWENPKTRAAIMNGIRSVENRSNPWKDPEKKKRILEGIRKYGEDRLLGTQKDRQSNHSPANPVVAHEGPGQGC